MKSRKVLKKVKKRVKKSRATTKLDLIYGMLEKNRNVKVGQISKKFRIDKKDAMEWCNVLIQHNLAELSYPIFGDAVLSLKES